MLSLKKTSLAALFVAAPTLVFAQMQPLDCIEIDEARAAGIAAAHEEIDHSEHYSEVEDDVAAAQDCMLDLSEFMGGSVGHGQLNSVISAMKDRLNSAACDSAKRAAQNAKNQADRAVSEFENQINEGIDQAVGGSVADYVDSIKDGEFAQSPDAVLRDWAAEQVRLEAEQKAAELQAELERRGYVNQQTPQERLNDLYDAISSVYRIN